MKNRIDQLHNYWTAMLIPALEGVKATGDSNMIWMAHRIVRRWTEFPELVGKPNAYSLGALDVITQRGISLEKLQWATYNDQTKKKGLGDPNHLHGMLHHEHLVPVSQLVKELLQLPVLTHQTVLELIQQRTQVAWILKSEQKALDKVCKSGNRSKELLESLGIVLVNAEVIG